MGRVCRAPNCITGSAADLKRRRNFKLRKPLFFRVPKSPTERQKWMDSLSTQLSKNHYICELHFPKDSIQHSYITNLPNGVVNIIKKGRISLPRNAIPVTVNTILSPIIDDNGKQVYLYKPADKPELCYENAPDQQKTIVEHQGKPLNKPSIKLELHEEDEQEQQPQAIEQQFSDDDIKIESQESSNFSYQQNEPINKNLRWGRLVAERELSYRDENVTLTSPENSEPEIDFNSQINLDNDAEILKIIVELNKLFPISWCFMPGINRLIAIHFDRYKIKERVRLIVSKDQSVLVTFMEHYEEKIDAHIKSLNDLIKCLKDMERKKLCTGTGIDIKSYSSKCHGDVTDLYKHFCASPRCPECRQLRTKLLKFKNSQKANVMDKRTKEISNSTKLRLCEKHSLMNSSFQQ